MVMVRGTWFRRLALQGIVLHTLVLTIADFEHHDLLCHFKTPLHCTSCAIGSAGSEPRTPSAAGSCSLSDAGRIVALHDVGSTVLLPVRTRDRSPPSLS